MRRRLLGPTTCLLSLLSIAAGGQRSQSHSAAPHPDLQGIWTNNFATPLERPKELAQRPLLSDEDVAALNKASERSFREGQAMVVPSERTLTTLLNDPSRFASVANYDGTFFTPLRFEKRTSLITDPPDGRLPAYTAAGRERLVAKAPVVNTVQDLPPDTRCITFGMPRIAGIAGSPSAGVYAYYQVVQTESYVVFLMEAVHEARIIPLDGGAHLPSPMRAWDGDSRGHWEGDTLVVDTANFRPAQNFLGAGDHLHLVERFRRVAADELDYDIRVDDATTWTRPWSAMVRMTRTDERIFEFGCHEGNEAIIKALLTAPAPEKHED